MKCIIPEMCQALKSGYDLVVGSRLSKASNMRQGSLSLIRKQGTLFATFVVNKLTSLKNLRSHEWFFYGEKGALSVDGKIP